MKSTVLVVLFRRVRCSEDSLRFFVTGQPSSDQAETVPHGYNMY